jgi:3D (Asp-Asp-Asp) domain-containing protein
VKKAKTKSFYSLFAYSKPALTMIFLVTIVCVFAYIIGTSYANDNSRMNLLSSAVTKHDIKRLENPGFEGADEWQTIRMRVTAYCPCPKCCGRYSDGITASGRKIRPGDSFVAADKKYPFGTEMIVPGYSNNEAVKVLDRGGVIRGNRLDVFFESHEDALKWGVKNLDVKVRRKR